MVFRAWLGKVTRSWRPQPIMTRPGVEPAGAPCCSCMLLKSLFLCGLKCPIPWVTVEHFGAGARRVWFEFSGPEQNEHANPGWDERRLDSCAGWGERATLMGFTDLRELVWGSTRRRRMVLNLFVPDLVWRSRAGGPGLEPVRRAERPDTWLDTVYRDEFVVTQINDGAGATVRSGTSAEHRMTGCCPPRASTGCPTPGSPRPSLAG